jgi:ceramide glucosyltransferase
VWFNIVLASLACLSVLLLLWQWLAAAKFPLHTRIQRSGFHPAVTLLKPLKGCDAATEECLRSWFSLTYPGEVQILFGVADLNDPVCATVRKLQAEFPAVAAELLECDASRGANAKVSKLIQMARRARHEVWVISDADVRVPPDLLFEVVQPLRHASIGLVNCFYRLSGASTAAMRWEAVAINADFWSQVLQARSLKPLDFALGAVMATRKADLLSIGGFQALQDCLADDYQLGNRLAAKSRQIALCSVVVDCLSAPMGWSAVWNHQLRWARTVRVCQPLPCCFGLGWCLGGLLPCFWVPRSGSGSCSLDTSNPAWKAGPPNGQTRCWPQPKICYRWASGVPPSWAIVSSGAGK